MRTHARAHAHARGHANARIHARTRQRRRCTHTRTHTHTHTHTHSEVARAVEPATAERGAVIAELGHEADVRSLPARGEQLHDIAHAEHDAVITAEARRVSVST